MSEILIGYEASFSKAYNSDDIQRFSIISGDDNPIHIDDGYASQSVFGQRVVHGVLLVSMFSKIFGTIYPGNGTIYLSQASKFLKPAFVGDTITAKVKLLEFNEQKSLGVFLTECYKINGELILTGEAKILFPKSFMS